MPHATSRVIPFAGGVRSTRDEGCALRNYLLDHPAERVLVVTNEYHSRRARWTIRSKVRELNTQVRLVAAPNTTGSHEPPARLFVNEYLKLAASFVVDGTSPGC